MERMREVRDWVFYSPTDGRVSFRDVFEDIAQEISRDAAHPLRVCVGTDSEEVREGVKFVAVVLLWRVGRGARAYYVTEIDKVMRLRKRIGSARFRDRIVKEVMMTAILAAEIRTALHDQYGTALPTGLQVHADVGENGGSSVMLREVIGMLQGYGFRIEDIRVKPDAFVASSVADKAI